jgi:DNA-binding NtrC family response regulator
MTRGDAQGHIVLVDDDAGGREAMTRALSKVGFRVEPFADGLDALAYVRAHPHVELVVTDLKMPRIDGLEVLRRAREIVPDVGVLMVTAHGSVETAVDAMKYGAEDYLEKPVNLDVLRRRATNLVEKVRLGREVMEFRQLESVLDEAGVFEGMVGRSPAMIELYRKIRQLADAKTPVLILGESGTGKELVARAIHRLSPRAREAFLPFDCASIPHHLLESEIFGHERGAFTGADARKPGKFEMASSGTLFLDEIGEMELDLQAKFLRALETQTFMRVGGTAQLEVDVRVLAATHRDLGALVDTGEFRRDLYYRLAVLTLRIPPLRERAEDIPRIASYFLERFAKEHGRPAPQLLPDALQTLVRAPWPGNVRELRNLMESLVILHSGDELGAAQLPEELRRAADANVEPEAADVFEPPQGEAFVGRTMEEIEREAILRSLERTSGNRTQAAEMLGIGLRTLQRKIKQYKAEGFAVKDGE